MLTGVPLADPMVPDSPPSREAPPALPWGEGRHPEPPVRSPFVAAAEELSFTLDAAGRVRSLSAGWGGLLGRPVGQLVGAPFSALVVPGEVAIVAAALAFPPGDGAPRSFRSRFLADGPVRVLQVWAFPDSGGEIVHGLARDVNEGAVLDQRVRLADAVFEHALEAIMVTNLSGVMVAVNPAFEEITGFRAEDAIGKQPRLLRPGGFERFQIEELLANLSTDGRWQGEVWNRRRNGELYPQWLSIGSARDDSGKVTHFVAMFSDVTALRISESRLERLAHFDPLTGLANRTLLYSRIEHAIAVSRRTHSRFGVLFLDLDRFKNINDSLGHAVGDELLVALSRRVALRIREQDTFARLGGDEFVVLLENLKEMGEPALLAAALAEQLSEPFTLSNGATLYVSASMGIALYPEHGGDAATLLQNADAAMYHAKEAGRSTYRFYVPALTDAVHRRLELDTRLRGAIERNEFVLHYQAKFDGEGQVCGAEALVRWQPPGAPLIPPNEFIPVAEETGLIVTLGDWVLEEACKAAMRWRRAGLGDVPVAVNLSAVQLRSRTMVDRLREILRRTELPPELLECEITESAVMEPVQDAILHLDAMRSLGVRLSIDDFGTGYSCLASLKRLPVNVLKIDQSFVRGLPGDASDTQIVRTILTMAHNLGLGAIAEGVETVGQFHLLRDLGCPRFQGYYFARPQREVEFAERLRGARA